MQPVLNTIRGCVAQDGNIHLSLFLKHAFYNLKLGFGATFEVLLIFFSELRKMIENSEADSYFICIIQSS